jgi:hypothetical protein
MCLETTNIKGLSNWNWEGDHIVHECIVPSSRPVIGFPDKRKYDIDVREFLITERNEIMKRTIHEDIKKHILSQHGGDWEFFCSRLPGSFDYRADIIRTFVSETISYDAKSGRDPWLFPDETLFVKKGDCEDRAFVIASLLVASGISSYNVRVALGKVKTLKGKTFDHMWVMYKNEDGRWMLIEPLIVRVGARKSSMSWTGKSDSGREVVEYIPSYVFNSDHLWIVKHEHEFENLQDFIARDWNKFDPKFAGEAHRTILNAALHSADEGVIQKLNGYFSRAVLKIVGPIVDDIDRRTYDPRDHFDNGYIKEGWEQVAARLADFKSDNTKKLDSFAMAAHGIADFYAHSAYAHFAKIKGSGKLAYAEPFNPSNPEEGFGIDRDYSKGSTFDLTGNTFSINTTYWAASNKKKIPAVWAGRLVSGRYAQKGDSRGDIIKSIIEATMNIPADLQSVKDFYLRGSLPHHNEIAVDGPAPGSDHVLYHDKSPENRMVFANQFIWRRNAAILHVRKAFYDNWTGQRPKWTMPPVLSETGI